MKQAATVLRIVTARNQGRIDDNEARRNLDHYQIRGSFRDDGSFIGYDYDNQEWIDTNDEEDKS